MPAIPAVKGTRDFYPEAMALRNWLYEKVRLVSRAFGYTEYEAPYLERLELYAAKAGEELVQEQAYVFKDRGGDLIALRPELTLSLARMIAARSRALPRPIRWWSFGPIWRYERPQKGRSREFFQWNIDLLGVESPEADAEIAAVAVALFRAVGLGPDKIRLLVNNRRVAEARYASIGIGPGQMPSALRLVDRRDKLSEADWRAYGVELGFSEPTLEGLVEVLTDRDAWKASDELRAFFEAASDLGVSEYLDFEPLIVRGLDYYTGTVFEARDIDGRFRAILGGGRYDNLVADVGGDRIPGVGFAMGDVTFGLLLEQAGVEPKRMDPPAQVLVCPIDEPASREALRTASRLRAAGVQVEWYPLPDRLPRQLKYADRQGIPLAVILGSREIEAGSAAVKDLRTGQQTQVPLAEIEGRLIEQLERLDPASC
ncbi:MAG TPA: histidine--tRNA ligase [Anaerolineales bacterium]|nr:histidine--tRNA ligase [Anaerolineales bacterium]